MADINVYDRLKELGITLPQAGAPAAAYVMSAQSCNTVYVSGHIAKKDGKVWAGKLGDKVGVHVLRLYVSGLNLATWDKMKIWDPESTAGDGHYYPQARILNVGGRITF